MGAEPEENPDPWCTSPEEADPNEVTDIVTEDYHPDRWGNN